MTCATAKFDVATCNNLEGAFTRKYIILVLPWGQGHTNATSCDLCTCEVYSCYVQWFRRICIYKKIHYMTWTLGQGHTKCCPVSSTSDTYAPLKFEVATSNGLGDAFTR